MSAHMEDNSTSLLEPTASVVAAFVAKQNISSTDVPALIAAVHKALSSLLAPEAPETVKLTPAQIRKSITSDALISFEDGKPYRTLKRHLTTRGMTPAEYKAKWGLPSDYPTTAPSYSAMRSAMAKALGLGAGRRKQPQAAAATPAKTQSPPAKRPARRVRPKKATPGAPGGQP
jgi:predicted transcriptional regulator